MVSDRDCGCWGYEFFGDCKGPAAALVGLEALGEAPEFHGPAKVAADPIVV